MEPKCCVLTAGTTLSSKGKHSVGSGDMCRVLTSGVAGYDLYHKNLALRAGRGRICGAMEMGRPLGVSCKTEDFCLGYREHTGGHIETRDFRAEQMTL